MKFILGIAILCLWAPTAARTIAPSASPAPMLAQAADVSVADVVPTGFAQLGLSGLALFVVWWVVCKTLPEVLKSLAEAAKDANVEIARLNNESIDGLAAQLASMSAQIREDNNRHLTLLERLVREHKGE